VRVSATATDGFTIQFTAAPVGAQGRAILDAAAAPAEAILDRAEAADQARATLDVAESLELDEVISDRVAGAQELDRAVAVDPGRATSDRAAEAQVLGVAILDKPAAEPCRVTSGRAVEEPFDLDKARPDGSAQASTLAQIVQRPSPIAVRQTALWAARLADLTAAVEDSAAADSVAEVSAVAEVSVAAAVDSVAAEADSAVVEDAAGSF
jgi:hypothetical protein